MQISYRQTKPTKQTDTVTRQRTYLPTEFYETIPDASCG